MRWWGVYPLPASGQVSNVSAVVLSKPMPAGDHKQVPMFGGEGLPELLAQLVRTAELQQQTATIQAALVQQELHLLRTGALDSSRGPLKRNFSVARASRPYRPANVEHRTWRGFVGAMQKLERAARAADLKPTKRAVCQLGADSVKTVTRTMLHYGLHADDWPPSGWNADQPGVSGHK